MEDTVSPIVAAVGLDAVTQDMADAATDIARRAGAPIVPIHAIPPRRLFLLAKERVDKVREKILSYFSLALSEGITVIEPVVQRGEPTELILQTASKCGAQMIVAGGGEPQTIKQWLSGSVPEQLVRRARQPVFVARGTMPGPEGVIVCPVDLSPQSNLAFTLALRMARLFKAPLRVVTVIPPDRVLFFGNEDLEHSADRVEAKVREELDKLVAAHDDAGVELEIEVLGGRPASQILEASRDAHLVVLGSSGFDYLLPGTFGGTTEKVFRGAWSSVLALRDADPDRAARESKLQHVAELRNEAEALLEKGAFAMAAEWTRAAIEEAPGNAALYELLGRALEAMGQDAKAADQRGIARFIRDSLG